MGRDAEVRFETVFLGNDTPDDERIDRLIYWCRRFDELGIVPESAGNLSFRTEIGFVITATGVELGVVVREDFVEVSGVEIDGGKPIVHARGRRIPSSESVLHSGIYDLRPEINAVFHTHDGLVLEHAGKLELPCTGEEQPPGSYELAGEVKRVLEVGQGIRYLVLRNHGVIAMGDAVDEAGRLIEDMNGMARDVAREGAGGK